MKALSCDLEGLCSVNVTSAGDLLIQFVLYGRYLIAINFGMHATLLPNGQALQRCCFEYVR